MIDARRLENVSNSILCQIDLMSLEMLPSKALMKHVVLRKNTHKYMNVIRHYHKSTELILLTI